MHLPTLVIIGGGFSGLMTAANIVAQSQKPLRIIVFDPTQQVGQGLAYATKDLSHLLNVRAAKMGAWSGHADGFYQWLSTNSHYQSHYTADSFVPRAIFAEYLNHIHATMQAQALTKNIIIQHESQIAVSLTTKNNGYDVRCEDGQIFHANAVVLASGNPLPEPSRMLPGLKQVDARNILPSAWDSQALAKRVKELPESGCIFILGAGLTMVDSILTLRREGYQGRIIALSRKGHLPLPHLDHMQPATTDIVAALDASAPNVRDWMRLIRDRVRRAQHEGSDWRVVIDALRVDTIRLWQTLPNQEKSRFFRHVFGLWNIHRHRMAPEIHTHIMQLQDTATLKLMRGRIQSVAQQGAQICISVLHTDGQVEQIQANAVMLCAGPGYHFARGGSPLYADMLTQGLVESDPCGYGVIVPDSSKGLFAIGTPCIGRRLESTAVPELREQAQVVALSALPIL
ncbi:MAG: FAD/NAD(P)-binding protein [Rickettsiales bacterium]|nr:FAD/NAD(P)-binding protein [Rickettsiales bacterium]